MWNKIKLSFDSSLLLNAINFAIPAIIAFLIKPILVFVVLGLFIAGWALNIYVNNAEYTLAHVCSEEDMKSILKDGFREGVAEANLTDEEKKLFTQRGVSDNVCFTIDSLDPVLKMRRRLDKNANYTCIYFKLGDINNIRSSTMVTREFFIDVSHGSIIEAGVHRDKINKLIREGKYQLGKDDSHGRGFKVLLADIVKTVWTDLTLEQAFAISRDKRITI